MPEPPPPGDGLSDFYFVDAADPEDGVRKLIHMVRDRIPVASAWTRCATSRSCAR